MTDTAEGLAAKAVLSFRRQLGQERRPGEWYLIDQARINQFAAVIHDQNFIHVDPTACAERSPYKTTVAHGFLTLSLLSHLVRQIPDPSPFDGVKLSINYGFNRVRFVNVVKVDSRIRARWRPIDVELKSPSVIHVTHEVTVDIEHEEKPACVADWIIRLVYT